MKRLTTLLATLAALALGVRPAYAWDDFGHRVVARIAWENMTPQARARAIAILRGASPETGLRGTVSGTLSQEQQIELFVFAATWPDVVRDTAFSNALRMERYHHPYRHYVDTFDLRRRCCLYLTYYAFGDTRKRGMAILRFTHAYRSAGFEPVGEELPDHLAVACELAARDLPAGQRLLGEHRAGVELLRLALDDAGSPYLSVVDLVRDLLHDPAPHDLQRALELARSGPPAEEVGLEPFAPPESIGARR